MPFPARTALLMDRSLETLCIAAFLGAVLVLSIFTLVNLDLGFHLGSGAYIWRHGAIPTRDPFSYVAEGRPWVDSHWLFQVGIHGLHAALGAPGLVLLRVATVLPTFALLLAAARRRAGLPIALLVCGLAVLVSYHRFLVRPELLTLLFLTLYVVGVEALSRHPRRVLVGLPLVQAVWVNCHGLWILGPAYLALHLLGAFAQRLAGRRWPAFSDPDPGDPPRPGREAALLGLCALASLANANGLAGILYPWTLAVELAGGAPWFPALIELQSPLSQSVSHPLRPELVFRVFLAISGGALLLGWRRTRLADLLPFLAFGLLAIRSLRNLPLFAVVAVPLTATALRGTWEALVSAGRVRPPSRRTATVATATLTVLIAGGLSAAAATNALYRWVDFPRRFGIHESDTYPVRLVDSLRSLDGRIFNDSRIGGYLIWKLYPEKQVARDGRWEVYGELIPELERILSSPSLFSEFARRYDVRTIVMMRGSSDHALMRPWLRRSSEFKLARIEGRAFVYRRERDPDPPPSPTGEAPTTP